MINIKTLQNAYKSNTINNKQIQRNTITFPFNSKHPQLINKKITPYVYDTSSSKVETNNNNIHTFHIKPKLIFADKYPLYVANKASVSFSKETT